jgi:hypothetical protein
LEKDLYDARGQDSRAREANKKAMVMTSQVPSTPARASRPSGRRRFAAAAASLVGLAFMFGATGCADLMGPRTLSISESELTLLLARQFPMDRKVLEVIDLEVANPQIHLLPDRNRIGTDVDVSALDRLFGTRAQGRVKLDYALRFEPSDHSIRMSQVRVRDLALESGSSTLHGTAQRIGTLVAENVLENLALYKMKPGQADQMDRLNLVAGPITVTAQGIQMTISPKTN